MGSSTDPQATQLAYIDRCISLVYPECTYIDAYPSYHVQVASAPSIPAFHQSYGYEEGASGTLVMQKPPDPVHTGCKSDTVGPGSYSPSLMPPATKAVAWGKNKRGMKYTTDVPGPGAYDPAKPSSKAHSGPVVVVVNGMEILFGGTNGTSQFASKVGLSFLLLSLSVIKTF